MPSRNTLVHDHITAQFWYSRFTPDQYAADHALLQRVDQAPCITLAQFRHVAKQQGWTSDSLAAFVKGELDEPKRTIDRITAATRIRCSLLHLLLVYSRCSYHVLSALPSVGASARAVEGRP